MPRPPNIYEGKTLKEWAAETDIPVKTLRERWKRGKRGDELLAPPARGRAVWQGMTITELARKHGLNYSTVAMRYRAGKRGAELIRPARRLRPKEVRHDA